ncbi:hypothetical protein ACX6XY_07435 [Streptomyces sp. O3]
MPSDDVRAPADGVAAADDRPRVISGPRHAAPKKPLLTRLQMPAGKAVALAAMPSAVLMGMGLTPTLAQAKPQPDNPFREGPCVTAPDAEAEDGKDAEDTADAEGADERADKADKANKANGNTDDEGAKGPEGSPDSASDAKEPTPSPSATASGAESGSGSDDKADDKAAPTPSPTPSASSGQSAEPEPDREPDPSPSKTKNPLDPLGVGDALKEFGEDVKDFFTPGDDKETEQAEDAASPTPSPSSSAQDAAKDDDGSDESPADKVTKPVKDTVDAVQDGLDSAADKAKESADKALNEADKADKANEADGAKQKAEADAGAETGAEAEPSPDATDPMAPDEDGKVPFPCVVEQKVAGEYETPPAPIPNDPWELEASSLLLKGLDYKGVVNLRTPDGRVKQALKFTVDDGTDIGDLHQIVAGPAGKRYHVEAARGSTSTIRGGQTIMYTERLQGNLFGLIPIVFDPEHPPPLNVPIAYFTKVRVIQAGQFGGTLHVPGLHQSISG